MIGRRFIWVGECVLALALGAIPAATYGAAAIKKGLAQTSIGVHGADKTLNQIQLAFDPDEAPADPTPDDVPPIYATTAFQLTVLYNPWEVTPTKILPEPDYTFTSKPKINSKKGTITIDGVSSVPLADLPTGDVDIFTIAFTLKRCVSDNLPLCFTIEAANNSDYIQGTDPGTGGVVEANGGGQVGPASITVSLNQAIKDSASSTPLPLGVEAGMVGLLGAMVGVGWMKRRKRVELV